MMMRIDIHTISAMGSGRCNNSVSVIRDTVMVAVGTADAISDI
jgi:hypothetical protein